MKTVPAGELFGEASAASPPSPSGQRMIRPRLPALTAELVALPVDVIVAGGDVAIEAARRATTAIPIVMAVASEAVARGSCRVSPDRAAM